VFQKLHTEEYEIIYHIPSLFSFPLISAVVEKNQSGNIYVDKKETPQIVFIINHAGFSYLFAAIKIDFNRLIDFFLQEKTIPRYFHLYDPPTGLIDFTLKRKELGVKLRARIQLRYTKSYIRPEKYKPAMPLAIRHIDSGNFSELDVFNLHLDKKFWTSKEAFLKEGYGIFLTNETGIPVTLCYSVSVSRGLAEIDIMTRPEYQGLGLAKYVTALFVEQSINKNIQANWDCFEENLGSLKTALSLGFESMYKYSLLSIFDKSI